MLWYAAGMKRLIFIAALGLAGCGQSAGEKAEAEYRIAATSVIDRAGKKCSAANRVAAAYAQDGDQRSYEQWELTAYNDCFEARR